MEKNSAIINLDSLLNLSGRLNETYDEHFILNSALLSLMGKLKILRACAIVPDSKKTFKVLISKGSILPLNELIENKVNTLNNNSTLSEIVTSLNRYGFENILQVKYRDELLAILCLSYKLNNEKLTEEEQHYSNLVCTITANALQNARNHRLMIVEKNNVEKRNQLLSTLFDIARDFSTLMSQDQIVKMLSYQLMGQLTISKFAIIISDDDDNYDVIINRFTEKPPLDIYRHIINNSDYFLLDNISDNSKIATYLKSINGRIIAPMKVQGKVKGILVIGNKLTGESFSEENLLFIEALGNIAISALENERLFKQEIEKKRLDNELTMALEIQKKLLPKEIPVIPGYNIAAISIPSRYVGGDYYDIIKLPDGNIIIAIADVSGKGMPAALIMANVQAALRILSNLSTDIADIILQINNIVYQNTSEDKFITFFCGIINPSKQTFRYINAGHNPPILINKENVVYNLDKGGLILGFMEKPFEYQSEVINLNSGDIVFFYTDGVTEAQNQQSEELGIEASVNIILKNKEKTVNNLLDAILANVFNLSKNGTEHDDITCILLKVE